MITASYTFEHGYAKPVYRGVVLWNGSRDDIGPENPQRWFDDLIYELIDAEGPWPSVYDLKDVKVTIEIGEVTK